MRTWFLTGNMSHSHEVSKFSRPKSLRKKLKSARRHGLKRSDAWRSKWIFTWRSQSNGDLMSLRKVVLRSELRELLQFERNRDESKYLVIITGSSEAWECWNDAQDGWRIFRISYKDVESLVDFLSLLGFTTSPKRIRDFFVKWASWRSIQQKLAMQGLVKYIHSDKLLKLELTHLNITCSLTSGISPSSTDFYFLT